MRYFIIIFSICFLTVSKAQNIPNLDNTIWEVKKGDENDSILVLNKAIYDTKTINNLTFWNLKNEGIFKREVITVTPKYYLAGDSLIKTIGSSEYYEEYGQWRYFEKSTIKVLINSKVYSYNVEEKNKDGLILKFVSVQDQDKSVLSISFKPNSIKVKNEKTMDSIVLAAASKLKQNSYVSITIVPNADFENKDLKKSKGEIQNLIQRRGELIRNKLIEQGISINRITIIFGNPIKSTTNTYLEFW